MSKARDQAQKEALQKAKDKAAADAQRQNHWTVPPSGLSITRKGNTITFSWKRMDADYGDGQQLQYRFGSDGWKSKDIGTGTTSTSITIPVEKYYPTTSKKLTSISFKVRGRRKPYTKTYSATVSYKEKQGKQTVKKEVTEKVSRTYSMPWSEWSTKTFTLSKPSKPGLSATLSDASTNVTTFGWSVATAAEGGKHFRDIERYTALVKNSNNTDGAKVSGWTARATGGASGSVRMTEDSTTLATGNSYTRWIRVRSRGVAGASDWAYIKHIYAQPYQASNVAVSAKVTAAGGFSCRASWKTTSPKMRPIDNITVQYTLATPETKLSCPSGASWSTGTHVAFKDGTDAAQFSIDDTLNEDQCLFIRVNTEHDAIYDSNYGKTYGVPVFAAAGKLKEPTGLSVEADDTTYRATITATNKSDVEDSFLAVMHKWSKEPNKQFVVGIIPAGSDTVTVQCPNWTGKGTISFGVYACVGTYTRQLRSDGVYVYSIKALPGKALMKSDTTWDGGTVASPPSGLRVEPTDVRGSARVSWNWNWSGATGAEVAWSDHADAWESTDEPSSYVVGNMHTPSWNIADLELGKTWYIRARFVRDAGEGISYSAWSGAVSIDLSVPPENPSLSLSSPFVVVNGTVTASWAFVAADNSRQARAQICLATISGGKVTYGKIIATVTTDQRVVLNAGTLGWEAGKTYNLCVKVTSTSGRTSEKWSDPVSVIVVPPLVCSIAQTSLVDGALTEMPLTVQAAIQSGVVYTLAVERAHSYYMERPDENIFEGHEGETVALMTGDGNFTIGLSDLVGIIDDGAAYNIILTATDRYGQTAQADPLYFEVHWAHQAITPMADAWTDTDDYITLIKPVAPDGTQNTDRCDIYRLSADKPVLLYKDAEFGVNYVDPYPTIGSQGGHRIVMRTLNGDYIDKDNHPAWVDLQEAAGDYIDLDLAIIDFGDEQVFLEYNIEVSHTWEKDFKETRYLGGSVQGDWNPAIGRKLSLTAAMSRPEDDTAISVMRRLASYPGICNVRTPDGSSFAADVQVSEDSAYDNAGRIVTFSLTITRVDPEGPEGMTYDEWVTGTAADYRYDIDDGDLYEDSEEPSGYTFEATTGGDLEMVFDEETANDHISFEITDGKLVVIYGED